MTLFNEIFVLLPFALVACYIRSLRPLPELRILPSPFTFAYSIALTAFCDDFFYYILHRFEYHLYTIYFVSSECWHAIYLQVGVASSQSVQTRTQITSPIDYTDRCWGHLLHPIRARCEFDYCGNCIINSNYKIIGISFNHSYLSILGSVDIAVAHGSRICLPTLRHYCASLPALRIRNSVPFLPLPIGFDSRFPSRKTVQSNVRQIRVNGLCIRHRSALAT